MRYSKSLLSTVLLLFSVGVYAFGDYVDESNTNKQGQLQGQQQGQLQGQAQGQGQGQGQDQYQKALSLALQKQDASNKGVSTTVAISGSTQVDAQPSIAPALAPGDPTAPCIATYGVSGAAGGVVSLGGTGYEYDEICGGLEFFRATKDSNSKEVQAMRAVTIRATYAMLQRKIEDELGEDAYASAVGITVRDGSMAEVNYRGQQGGFIQASYGPDN